MIYQVLFFHWSLYVVCVDSISFLFSLYCTLVTKTLPPTVAPNPYPQFLCLAVPQTWLVVSWFLCNTVSFIRKTLPLSVCPPVCLVVLHSAETSPLLWKVSFAYITNVVWKLYFWKICTEEFFKSTSFWVLVAFVEFKKKR